MVSVFPCSTLRSLEENDKKYGVSVVFIKIQAGTKEGKR